MKLFLFAAAVTLVAIAQPASAEEASALPAACKAGMMHHQPAPPPMGHAMDEAHADLMKGMDAMHTEMMQGMMAEDIDVAFVCGMIPHHQGAIDMAKAVIAHGDDPWTKELAQKIIDAQTQEIAEMKTWLEKQAQ